MKKRLYSLSLGLLIVLCLVTVGCTKTDTNEITEKAKGEAVETFLNEFFSFNKQERYDTFSESVSSMDNVGELDETTGGVQELPEELQKAYEEYYQSFADMATQNCIDNMQANRLPMQYDSLIAQEGITAEIGDIQYESLNENAYTFEVSFKSDEANEILKEPIKGKVTIQISGKQVLVDSITIY